MRRIIGIFTIMFIAGAAFAAPPDAGMIQRSQQQLIEDELRQKELQDAAATSPYNAPQEQQKQSQQPIQPAGRCVEIQTISFGGNTIILSICL
jgi:hemolysin activation/secretion protein